MMMNLKLIALLLLSAAAAHAAQPQLLTVRQSFDSDPGWVGVNNRQIGTDMPVVKQDFGYSKTNHARGNRRARSAGGSCAPAAMRST